MRLFAQKDADDFVRTGSKEFRYDRETRITPGAKDALTEAGVKIIFQSNGSAPHGDPIATTLAGSAASTGAGPDEQLFRSKEAQELKEQICDIGRRIWMREYCDGNGGNISARLGPDRFIVTPTGVSKGFMKPEMLCMVDAAGNQLAGSWKRSSEFTTHAAIYRSTPQAMSVCHAHPCYAGAFAIKGLTPPPRLIPELEVFVGAVAYTPYKTPGGPDIAREIEPLAPKHQSILMGNHGVICWGKSVEDAYFKMEITDAYCRTVIHAQELPGGASIPCEKMSELLDMKKQMGLPDNRFDLKPAELCEVDPWVQMKDHQCACATPAQGGRASQPVTNADAEALVQRITDEIMASMQKGSR